MAQEFLMGNEAIALGALVAGVSMVTGYPGTPSSEILEVVAKRAPESVHVEWSVNEKVALEVAAGASYAGARSMVTMKQVGLNVASDPLMSLAYIGVKGGMVVVVADDPGPISSQTEQDTRRFAAFAKLPVFDPSSPEEAYEMIGDAFELSERYGTPVLFRPTTRVCHGNAPVTLRKIAPAPAPEGFIKGAKWVIFPRLSYQNHARLEAVLPEMGEEFADYRFNWLEPRRQAAGASAAAGGSTRVGIATGGVSAEYVREALASLGVSVGGGSGEVALLRVATPHPFPASLGREFLGGADDDDAALETVLVVEELDPVIEDELLRLVGTDHLPTTVLGKRTGHLPHAGEYNVAIITRVIADLLGIAAPEVPSCQPAPEAPARPPVLCAGCPHRASFLAVKQAMKGRKAVFSGDIGCYTLGNAAPLEMVDTCLCMGAGITIAQGLHRVEPDAINFAFIGDSTFFASGIPGVINAAYNNHDVVIVVLDNSTTAMTGGQTHPGLGRDVRGEVAAKIDIEGMLAACGVTYIETCNPMLLDEASRVVTRTVDHMQNEGGVSAIVFRFPCINVAPPGPLYAVDQEKCTRCRICITRLGCPAITQVAGVVSIDAALCYGCSVCEQVCPYDAIGVAR